MVLIWPFIHAILAALITTWDVLPPTSKAYDLFPNHIVAKIGKNATLNQVIKEWIWDTWRWGEPSLNPSVALTWVNGINYTNAEMEEQAQFLSALFGCRVRPYYNPSLGWWLKDLTRVSYMYIRSPTEDPVVTGLAKHLSMVLSEVGPKGRVVHLAHSGGALLTYLVAKYHLKEGDRRRIDVINFGGAKSITQKYFGKATNYYARNDPILLVNRRAMSLMQQILNNQTDGEVIYLKHNTSFVFLQGRAGDGLTDHAFIGPTYLTALHREAAVFRRAYYRAYWLEAFKIEKPPEMEWGRFLRKRTAAATGLHNFFSNSSYVKRISSSFSHNTTSSFLTFLGPIARNYSSTALNFSSSLGFFQWKKGLPASSLPSLLGPHSAPSLAKRVKNYWASYFEGLQPEAPVLPVRRPMLRRRGDHQHLKGRLATYRKPRWRRKSLFPSIYDTHEGEEGLEEGLEEEDVSLSIRRLRKVAARMTGMHHFFSRHRKERSLLLTIPPVREEASEVSPSDAAEETTTTTTTLLPTIISETPATNLTAEVVVGRERTETTETVGQGNETVAETSSCGNDTQQVTTTTNTTTTSSLEVAEENPATSEVPVQVVDQGSSKPVWWLRGHKREKSKDKYSPDPDSNVLVCPPERNGNNTTDDKDLANNEGEEVAVEGVNRTTTQEKLDENTTTVQAESSPAAK